MRRRVLFVVSGTLGDVLPVARIHNALKDHETSVLTNERYFPYFKGVAKCAAFPFDPQEVLLSSSGQRLLEGGFLGFRRLLGLYGTLNPLIGSSYRVAKDAFPTNDLVVVTGVPFLTGELAEKLDIPVIRILYQPHWPSAEIRSLYLNTPKNYSPTLNRSSHRGVELVARAMFGPEIRRTLQTATLPRHITHDSYWKRHKTLFLAPDSFANEPIRNSSNAVIAGFVRPEPTQDSSNFLVALQRIEQEAAQVLYVGFGSMVTSKTRDLIQSLSKAALNLGVAVAVQAKDDAIPRGPNVIPVPPGDHSRIFPLCDALIHHGGAGTTAASLDSGRPFVAIPQWGDQFYWHFRTQELGLAPHIELDRSHRPRDYEKVIRLLMDQKLMASNIVSARHFFAGNDGTNIALTTIERELA